MEYFRLLIDHNYKLIDHNEVDSGLFFKVNYLY